jgi:hypothetical protein
VIVDPHLAVVLLTAPSLRSDSVATTFEKLSKALRRRGPNLCGGENITMVLLGYSLIAAVAVIAASAIAGYLLANVINRCFTRSWTVARSAAGGSLPRSRSEKYLH